MPELCALSVTGNALLALKNGNGELFGGNLKNLCQELITPGDHLLLEVISQGPVAKHLKACEVVRVSHTVYISRPYALLVVCKTVSGRVLLAQKIGHQRMHAGGCEEDGGVVLRYDGRA